MVGVLDGLDVGLFEVGDEVGPTVGLTVGLSVGVVVRQVPHKMGQFSPTTNPNPEFVQEASVTPASSEQMDGGSRCPSQISFTVSVVVVGVVVELVVVDDGA